MSTTPMPGGTRGAARATQALNGRLESVAWGTFLILSGVLLLAPDELSPRGSWMIGIGLIMVGLNLARSLSGLAPGRVSTALGVLALAAGVAEALGLEAPLIPLVLVLIGVEVIVGGLRTGGRREHRAATHEAD